jgi:O-antigen/teichoic acid export membrane protein
VSKIALGKRDLGVTFVTNFLLAVTGFATGTLAARLLGPDGRGQLAAVQIWPTFLAGIAALGLPEAVIYFGAREPGEVKRYLLSAIALGLLSSFLLGTIGCFLLPYLLRAQSASIVSIATFYLLLIPLNILAGFPSQAFRGWGRFTLWNSCRMVPSLGWLAILLIAWGLGTRQLNFLIYAFLVILFAFAVFELFLVMSEMPGPLRVSSTTWPAMIKFGAPCLFTYVSQTLNLRMDQMLIAAFLKPRDLGLYVAAVAWSNAFNPAISALSAWFFPKVAGIHDTNDRQSLFARGLRMGIVLSSCLGMVLIVLTPLVFPFIFGPAYRLATTCAVVLVVAAMISGMNSLTEEGLRGLGKPGSALAAELSGLVVTAVSLAVLLRPMGIMGAAIASVAGYTTTFAVALYRSIRATGASLAALTSPRSDEIAVTAKLLYTSSLRFFNA